jgi:hypothetical protein
MGWLLAFSLTIIFFFCKVFGALSWSWWFIFLPLYLPFLALLGCLTCFLILGIYWGVKFEGI